MIWLFIVGYLIIGGFLGRVAVRYIFPLSKPDPFEAGSISLAVALAWPVVILVWLAGKTFDTERNY